MVLVAGVTTSGLLMAPGAAFVTLLAAVTDLTMATFGQVKAAFQ